MDPSQAGAGECLGHALLGQGRPAEAVRFARWAARLTGLRQPDVLLSLAEASPAAGRPPAAVAAAARALKAAQAGSPQMVPLIRRRLQEWRSRPGQATP